MRRNLDRRTGAPPLDSGLSGRGSAVASIAASVVPAVLLVGFAPGIGPEGQSLRRAIVLVGMTIGLLAVLTVCRRRDPPALAAGVFLATGAVATLASPAPRASLLGSWSWFVGLVAIAAFVGWWGFGCLLATYRGSVANGIVIGAVLNAAAGLFQVLQVLPLTVPDATAFGRASGLLGNPVHLGAVCAGALAISARRVVTHKQWVDALAVLSLAGGVNVAGGRAGLATALLGIALAVRRASFRLAILVVTLASVGVLASAAVSRAAPAPTTTGADRALALDARGRPGAWEAGIEALGDRPALGWGPGRFDAASTVRRTLESRRAEITPFDDAHNWVIEYSTTTGVLGLVALLAFLGLAGLRATGGLALFGLVVAANGLLQPASVAITPLAAMAIGAARRDVEFRPPRGGSVVAVVAGVVLAIVLVVGEHSAAKIAPTTAGVAASERAIRLLPDSPDLVSLAVGARVERGAPGDLERAERLAKDLIDIEPGVASHWEALAVVEARQGRRTRSIAAYRAALRRDPWSVAALRGLIELTEGDDSMIAVDACRRLRLVLPRTTC